MKCPICNGAGVCYEQKIRYKEIETSRTEMYLAKCNKCHGSGEVEMTNEEWIRTATTEQLAESILQQWIHGAYHGVGEFGLTDKEIESAKDDIVEWLKEIHNDK